MYDCSYINHDNKVFLMVAGPSHILQKLPPINGNFNGKPLTRVNVVKILGLYIDCKLTWQDHYNKIFAKCSLMLRTLYPLQYVLDYDPRLLLAQSLVLSNLYYACCICFRCKSNLQVRINQVIRNTGRFVTCKKSFDSISNDPLYKM